jgi:hypothetical protein
LGTTGVGIVAAMALSDMIGMATSIRLNSIVVEIQ